METKDIRNMIVAGIVAMLAGLGLGGSLLTSDQLSDTYICDGNMDVQLCYGGISGTHYTCYPYAENRTSPVRCKDAAGDKGEWIPLSEYAEANGIDPLTLLVGAEQAPAVDVGAGAGTGEVQKVRCDPAGCISI